VLEGLEESVQKNVARFLLHRKEVVAEGWQVRPGAASPHDSIAFKDTLLTVLTQGSHMPRFPVADALAAVAGGYEGFRDAAVVAWERDALPQFLVALRIAYWRERTHDPMDLRHWLIRLGEDDAAFGSVPGTRRRHRWLAMGFIVVFHHQSHSFPDTDFRALLDGLCYNQLVLASHIVAMGLEERVGTAWGDGVLRAYAGAFKKKLPGAFEAKQIERLAEEVVDWAKSRANNGDLVRSLRDADQFEALRLAGAIDADLRARIWSEAVDDTALDHLVDLFFGDEPQDGAGGAFGHLFESTKAIRDRLIARAEALGGPEPSDALRNAIDAMETRARFMASDRPRPPDPDRPEPTEEAPGGDGTAPGRIDASASGGEAAGGGDQPGP
jgi:hypothetical protein